MTTGNQGANAQKIAHDRAKTLRDEFAMACYSSAYQLFMLSAARGDGVKMLSQTAQMAYAMADAMLCEREKNKGGF